MDYYESVVIDYLRADRALFVNTEYCIQISPGHNPDKGKHWYCDAVVADFRTQSVFLCEISYAAELAALIKRLKSWHDNWDDIRGALERESRFPKEWLVDLQPWLFVPQKCVPTLQKGLSKIANAPPNFSPRITYLEKVQPWLYCSWDRADRVGKKGCCDRHELALSQAFPEAVVSSKEG
jgi:hypothetical protein